MDRDEPRFAQASRQMLQSGNWVVPRFQERTRLNKPPLIYWLQASAARLLGDPAAREPGAVPPADDPTGGIWRYRIPSAFAATITVLLTWRLGCRMFDPRAALLGAGLLAVCPSIAFDAHMARADQVLVATIVASQSALWSVWRSRRSASSPWLAPLAFWCALMLGVLTKGPVAPMIVGLTALSLSAVSRQWRWLLRLRPLAGLALIAAAAGAWLALVAGEVGWDRLSDMLRRELIERNTSPMEGHGGPPGYHFVAFLLLFWPGMLATFDGIARAWRRALGPGGPRAIARPASGRDAEMFCLAWIILPWLVFEIVSTKLPHYTMPLYPPIALLSARALLSLRPLPGRRPVSIHGIRVWSCIGAAVVAGAPIMLAFLVDRSDPTPIWANLGALAARLGALAALAYAVLLLLRSRVLEAQLWSMAAAVLTLAAVEGLILPYLTGEAWVSSRVVAALRTADPDLSRPLATVQYHEDSLVFLTGGRIQRIDETALTPVELGLDDWLAQHPHALAVIPESLVESRPWLHVIARVSGWNPARGRHVDLAIVEVAPPHPPP